MAIDQPGDAAIQFGAKQSALAVRTPDQPSLPIALLAVGITRRASIDRNAGVLDPAHGAIARQVLEQQASGIADPDQSLDPAKAIGERLERRIGQDVVGKSRIADFDIHSWRSPPLAGRCGRRRVIELDHHQHRRNIADGARPVSALAIDLAAVLIAPER